uniref:Uncharacterized protein n=1 Tax=Glossina morsitans morsitans TaxID=37546 RepID=A0A1B0G3I0_GLOMM
MRHTKFSFNRIDCVFFQHLFIESNSVLSPFSIDGTFFINLVK